MDLVSLISRAEQALSMLQMARPLLGDNADIITETADVVGKVLTGAKLGTEGYNELVKELDEVILELREIKSNGGVTGNDFRSVVGRIRTKGEILDSIKDRLES
jgi:hypothetical protein